MSDAREPIARVRLARSLPRLLAAPILLVVAGVAAVAAGLLVAAPPASFALVGLGATVAVGAIGALIVLLSVGFEVAESTVSMTWIGGRRVFPLVPGPVTRVRLRGSGASHLRPRSGGLGWGIGRAMLRREEEITLVRLAATPTAILIPTERGRLAVAPAREEELLEALASAARARQRAEEEAPEPDAEPEAIAAAEADEVAPAALTGIERALLEERLARERAEALAAEEAARAAAALQATEAEAAAPIPAAPPEPAPTAAPRRWTGLVRPRAGWVFALLPTAAAAAAWFAAGVAGRPPEPGSDLARLVSIALVLAGPATSIGAIMALAWWPRLVGVVVTGGLAATVFIGRALIG